MSVVERENERKRRGDGAARESCVSFASLHPVGLKMRPNLRKLKRQLFNLEHVKVLKKEGYILWAKHAALRSQRHETQPVNAKCSSLS
jgi:TnpA family transposase